MKNTIKLYLAMDSPLVAKGFESLIKSSQQAREIESFLLEEKEELSEIHFTESPDIKNVLIFDCNLNKGQNKLYMYNLLKTYPELKVIVMVKNFNYSEIKMLFNTGIMGVIDERIPANDFLTIFEKVLLGDKSLSPTIKNIIIEKFCQKEIIEVNLSHIEEVNYMKEVFSLTKREVEVLNLICNGKNTKEISEQLYISTHTAETHRRHLLGKLDVRNTAEMVKIAILNRLVPI